MKLIDRILVGNILPKEGKFETLLIIKDIRKKIELTQDEITQFEVKTTDNGMIEWNTEGAEKEFEIEFTESEKNEISTVLKKISEEGKLHETYLELYKIFVK